MQYIPGSSVTLSASLSYVQRNLPLPDDSEVGARVPKICVDYLSHEWLEEDVWKSWRNMTRHKSEITNGVRLENASWRTWWKQRNNLPTVSPETLNWLKDSDVTWLYGPLHTAAEPVPPPKQSTAEERLGLVGASGKKPILKHRTITELLQGNDHVPVSIGSPSLEAIGMDFSSPTRSREGSPRPHLPHTKSDSHIARPRSATGHHSPTRVSILDVHENDHESVHSRAVSPGQSDGLAGSTSNLSLNINPPAKRHISFNTFVEQCISIDDPNPTGANAQRSAIYESDDDLVPDDGEDDDVDSSTSSVLEMRAAPGVARRADERSGGPILRSNSTSQERERMTIAPIPPTLLKTSEELPAPSPQVVYQPPKEFIWDGPIEFANSNSESSSSGSTSSSDNLSSAMGSITGAPVDLGFVSPQWGRPPPPPGMVGKGSMGSVGPAGLEEDVYESSGYQEPPRPVVGAAAMSPPNRGIGFGAGRSKWVPESAIPDDEDEETTESSESSAASSAASGDEDEVVGVPSTSPPTIVSSSSTSSASRTVVGTPLVRSPPQPPRSVSSRTGSVSSQPGKSILKNSSAGGKGSSVGSAVEDPSGNPRHSEPIGIPATSIAHMPATATISTARPSVGSPNLLSPSVVQPDNLWYAPPVAAAPSNGRGRSSTRTSSSGISDRSRSSSKISGTSSPIGSVSPSGYGSPSGSRANSVMGNKRSSTDVGVARVASAGSRGVSARQASTSPPAVGSPLANSISASSLGTIVANVPMVSSSPPAAGERGPPLSRSGTANANINAVMAKRPRAVRTGSSSSLNSTGSGSSSGSSGTMHASRTPMDNIAQVLPPAPPPAKPLHVSPSRKGSLPPIVPAGEAAPTVITTPLATKPPSGVDSTSSSAGRSPSGGTLTMEGRDNKLDEAMRRNQAEKQATDTANVDGSDGETKDNGTFNEFKSTNPTPSNSPILGLSKLLSSSAPPPATTPPSSPPASSTSFGKKPTSVTVSSPNAKSSLSTPVVTPTSALAPTPDEHGIVGKAADTLMSSAKGLLGAIWGSGDGASGSR